MADLFWFNRFVLIHSVKHDEPFQCIHYHEDLMLVLAVGSIRIVCMERLGGRLYLIEECHNNCDSK